MYCTTHKFHYSNMFCVDLNTMMFTEIRIIGLCTDMLQLSKKNISFLVSEYFCFPYLNMCSGCIEQIQTSIQDTFSKVKSEVSEVCEARVRTRGLNILA